MSSTAATARTRPPDHHERSSRAQSSMLDPASSVRSSSRSPSVDSSHPGSGVGGRLMRRSLLLHRG